MSRFLSPPVALFLLVCLGPAGCGGGPREVPISGQVTLDGVPLPEGSIRFAPVDGGTTTQAATIKDGKFKAPLQSTTYRVEISATRISKNPRKPAPAGPGEDDPLIEELIPPRYNARSELKLEVKEARGRHLRLTDAEEGGKPRSASGAYLQTMSGARARNPTA